MQYCSFVNNNRSQKVLPDTITYKKCCHKKHSYSRIIVYLQDEHVLLDWVLVWYGPKGDWKQVWIELFRHPSVVDVVVVIVVVAVVVVVVAVVKCGGLEFPVMDIDHSLQSIIPTRACHGTDSIF